jgi:hypothetical protein
MLHSQLSLSKPARIFLQFFMRLWRKAPKENITYRHNPQISASIVFLPLEFAVKTFLLFQGQLFIHLCRLSF